MEPTHETTEPTPETAETAKKVAETAKITVSKSESVPRNPGWRPDPIIIPVRNKDLQTGLFSSEDFSLRFKEVYFLRDSNGGEIRVNNYGMVVRPPSLSKEPTIKFKLNEGSKDDTKEDIWLSSVDYTKTAYVEKLDWVGLMGNGHSSYVSKVHDPNTGKTYAVKVVEAYGYKQRKEVMSEMNSLLEYDSPYIIKLRNAYYYNHAMHMCLEFQDCGSLRNILQREKLIPEMILKSITFQILQGIKYLHERNVMHRDLKPANVCVHSDGSVKLVDLGISRFLEEDSEGRRECKTEIGTFSHMSPNRLLGYVYSFPSEVWSLGVILLESSLGYYPYPISETKNMEVVYKIVHTPVKRPSTKKYSPEFHDFLFKCLEKDVEDRQTVNEALNHVWLKDAEMVDIGSWLKEKDLIYVPQIQHNELTGGKSRHETQQFSPAHEPRKKGFRGRYSPNVSNPFEKY